MNVYAGSVHAGSYSIWYLEVFCTLTLRSSTLPRYDALTFVFVLRLSTFALSALCFAFSTCGAARIGQ